CFDIGGTVSIIEKALAAHKNGKILLPDKISQVFDEATQNRINCMPATLVDEKICGVKWVSVFPENPMLHGCPNVSGIIILSELERGYPFAAMDATFLTALRTACVGALASKHLARNDSRVIGLIGSGEQAKMHLIAMKHVHPEISICRVASRSAENSRRFIEGMSERFPEIEFSDCASDYDMAASDADIIVTAVSCQAPLLKASSVKPGAFYCHVGGWEDEYEVPLKADKIVCDSWESVKHRTQTLSRLWQAGRLKDEDIYADLEDIADGTKLGRENDREFIYFNSVGLSFIDIAVAADFCRRSLAKGLGTDWRMKASPVI
ncbi:MAG: ornithine cyclodeaminase family protein, partial [Synergistaceae bacterium]|nr:ornithine cyclodeaminase family protein [Synergistaceae bacterium]